MILATVGMQLPFHRFIRALDEVAGRLGVEVAAQTLELVPGLAHITQRPAFSPQEFDALAAQAQLIVGHAGVGTIVLAGRHEKPLVLFPRKAALGEHRNDHQMATARHFGGRRGIYVAHDAGELEGLIRRSDLHPYRPADTPQMQELVARVARFVAGDTHA